MGFWVCVPPNCGHLQVGEAPGKLTLDSGVPQEDPKGSPPVGSQPLWTGLPPSHQRSLCSSGLSRTLILLRTLPAPPTPTPNVFQKVFAYIQWRISPCKGFQLLRHPHSPPSSGPHPEPALPPPTWAKWGREPGNKLFSHPLLAWETYHHLPTPHNSHAHPHTHAKP